MTKSPKLSKKEAISQLWRMGELSWKLSAVQKEMKATIDTDSTKTSVIVCSRRLGKTYLLCVLALMQCLRQENSIVKFLFPKQTDAKKNIRPIMRELIEDCPLDIRPDFNTSDKIYYFKHNGSEIQLAGSDNGNVENIRGGKADLVLIDEAGFITDLKYAVRSVLSPTIRTTGGKIIMASTPSRSPDHEFITEFLVPYKADDRLKIYTIYDNPNFDEKTIQEIIEDYPRKENDPDFRREYLCEIAIDAESAICAEFSELKGHILFNDENASEIPPFKDFYVAMDVGFKDLTVGLFAYYDFKNAQLIIMDELVMNGPEMTTQKLAEEIKHKERLYFYDEQYNELISPYLRVMDNDLKLINDLHRLHGITFIATEKTHKEAAVNNLRIWVSNNRIKIHEKCKHLIYHLEYGQWDKHRKKFKHLADTPDKRIMGGHVDAVDSLIYMVRNVLESKNPYPEEYGKLIGQNVFSSMFKKDTTNIKETIFKMLNIKGN